VIQEVTRPIVEVCAVFLVLMVIGMASVPVAALTNTVKARPLSPEIQSSDVDGFAYRASFRLPGGLEGLLIRSSFAVTYLYQSQPPILSQLYMSVEMAFIYGKTILGRAVIQNISIGSIAYYPKWHDSSGHLHDMYMVNPLFAFNGSIADGQQAGGTLLMDSEAFSMYVIDLGGTLVIDRLVFILGDGQQVPLVQGKAEIVLEKYYNDFDPQAASLHATDNLTSTADSRMLTVFASGDAIIPLIVVLDYIIAFSLIGTAFLLIVFIVLHRTGRIRLPFGRVRTLMHRPNSRTREAHSQ
jgi:hypothetical protein